MPRLRYIEESEKTALRRESISKFVKSLNLVGWEEACEPNPRLAATQAAAE
jgi:hypothetical protein